MRDMWELGFPYNLTLISFLIGSPFAVVYPIILGFLKWNESRIGRSMMFKGIALALVFAQGLLSLYMYKQGWYPWFVFTVTTWLAFAVIYQTTTVIRTIIEGEIGARMEDRKRARMSKSKDDIEQNADDFAGEEVEPEHDLQPALFEMEVEK